MFIKAMPRSALWVLTIMTCLMQHLFYLFIFFTPIIHNSGDLFLTQDTHLIFLQVLDDALPTKQVTINN